MSRSGAIAVTLAASLVSLGCRTYSGSSCVCSRDEDFTDTEEILTELTCSEFLELQTEFVACVPGVASITGPSVVEALMDAGDPAWWTLLDRAGAAVAHPVVVVALPGD